MLAFKIFTLMFALQLNHKYVVVMFLKCVKTTIRFLLLNRINFDFFTFDDNIKIGVP